MFNKNQMHPLPVCALAGCILVLAACKPSPEKGYTASEKPAATTSGGPFPFSHDVERQSTIGPEACVECHAEAVESWRKSHHAKANRPVSASKDRAAFVPAQRVEESGVIYEMTEQDGQFVMHVIDNEVITETYTLVGVIGETPLRQYLAKLPGNKLQTISATYDVINQKWYDVYQGEDRLPGEWGHWTGQGMNWNSNCAYCHTTEYSKAYDFASDTYHSNWTQQSIACAECHTGLDEHVAAAKRGDYASGLTQLSSKQTMDNCVTCHARRDQLTADAFKPGDTFEDHFEVATPAQPGLYYADGQILDEVFVHASFSMSRMGHAGVHCMDCHDPHSMENILPVENNMLCMRCHEAGVDDAPVIIPTEHSFHAADSTGNRCVECHMPKTPYMQIDPRADHGFHSPDPLMTKELGIPNACSRCHTEETVDWAVEWSEKWYGDKLAQSRQRQRARAVTAAHAFEPEGMQALLTLAKDEDIPFWTGTYLSLLSNYLPNRLVEEFIKSKLDDESPVVRSHATTALSMTQGNATLLNDSLSDPSRNVRIAAARGLEMHGQLPDDSLGAKDFEAYLNFNIDRPQSLMTLANRASRVGDPAKITRYLDRAVAYDQANAEVYRQSAILLSGAGMNAQAEAKLHEGWALDRDNALFPYSLGLLAAEQNDLEKSVGYLEETVAMQPDFYRAWYNLSLAYQKQNRQDDAARAMQRAQGGQ